MKIGRLSRGVSVAGAAYTPMGIVGKNPELEGWSERDFASLACIEAMEDAGIEAKDIDAYIVGSCGPNFYSNAVSASAHYGDWIGLRDKPALFHDEGCATSTVGLVNAITWVASGVYDCVLSFGINEVNSVPQGLYPPFIREDMDFDRMMGAMYAANDTAYEKPGAGLNAEASLILYLKKYGYSVKNFEEAMNNYLALQRKNALNNPKCLIQTKTLEEEAGELDFSDVNEYLLNDIFNPQVMGCIRAKYLGVAVDGSAAVIVCSTDMAKKLHKKPIEVLGVGAASNINKGWLDYPTRAVENYIGAAMGMAGLSAGDVDYVGLHDCTGTALFTETEQVGYFKPGEAMRAIIEGRMAIDKDKPINTSGGRMQTGHPTAGALGIEVTEAVKQMRGENGARQIANPPGICAITSQGAGYNMASVILKTV